LALNNLRSVKNHGGVDRALLSFDLHVSGGGVSFSVLRH
jgi:hypothetical protein